MRRRSEDSETARQILAAFDTRLDTAGTWSVMQVQFHTRMVGHASLGMIAARRRLPPDVLAPVFKRLVDEGYLTHRGSYFSTTQAGRREADAIDQAWGDCASRSRQT